MLTNKTSLKSKIFSYLFPVSLLLSSCDTLLDEYDIYQGMDKGKEIYTSGRKNYVWLVTTGRGFFNNEDVFILGVKDEMGIENYTQPFTKEVNFFPDKNGYIYLYITHINGANTLQDTTDNWVHVQVYEDDLLLF